jgi:hypothetical protein
MKRPLLVLASLAMALTPAIPARAALVADTGEKPTVLNCLGLLFSNPEEHAAKCGGPFEMNTNPETLVKGTSGVGGCEVGFTDLPIYGLDQVVWRLDVAGTCCATVSPLDPRQQTHGQWILPVGQRILVAC